MTDLLLEIGCEEIPAKMLARALADLPAAIAARLTAARLAHGAVRVLGTPRRIAIIVSALVDRQPDLREEVVGPPVSAAKAPDGSLTKAGQGFAAKNGVAPESLVTREVAGKKGQYVVALREVHGQATRALLPALLAEVCAAIAWPKSMRWGWAETTFVRPVQWLVAIYGGEVVPFSWAGIASGRASRGHRFLASGLVEIADAASYVDALRAASVVVDPDERRATVERELARIAAETGLRVRRDDALIAEVIHLGELPVGVVGTFDPAFLEVPEEMIVTAMRTHQRYFALESADGKLANRFVTIAATRVTDPAVVARGNETVLAARLSDAKFFFTEDKKKTYADWNGKLDHVVFVHKLGERARTTGHKIRRIAAMVAAVGGSADAIRAAELCKADLASHAVGEFPEVQGTMGRHYAKHHGERAAVGLAIEESYWPKGQGAALPTTADGALVAIADRLDTLVGCFATGQVPTGSADPFALRRAAIGVLAILLDRAPGGAHAESAARPWAFELDQWIEQATLAYGDTLAISPKTLDDAMDELFSFMTVRLRGLLIDEGLPAQDVDVAIGATAQHPVDVRGRAQALAVVPAAAREVFKRIANILDDARAKQIDFSLTPDPALFAGGETSAGVEATLWSALRERTARLHAAHGARDYGAMFQILVEIQPAVAAFFDKGGVMVMDPDPKLRENRLSLLNAIYERFSTIGDFRKLGAAS